MNAPVLILPLLLPFVHCFTAPGFEHFAHFALAHMALLGIPHCVTETLRLTQFHTLVHWTTPYAFMKRGRWSCWQVSQCLLAVIATTRGVPAEVVVAIDDTLVNHGHLGDKSPGILGTSVTASHRRPWIITRGF